MPSLFLLCLVWSGCLLGLVSFTEGAAIEPVPMLYDGTILRVYMSINYSMPKESSLFKEVNFNDDIYNRWGQCLTETGGRVAPGGQPWKKILGVT